MNESCPGQVPEEKEWMGWMSLVTVEAVLQHDILSCILLLATKCDVTIHGNFDMSVCWYIN